jgi:hypothetical protein
MKTDYSKPSADIAQETAGWQARDEETLAWQRSVSKHLKDAPRRESCMLCGAGLLAAERYCHRETAYLICPGCTHLQTEARLPSGYPQAVAGTGFETVYPRLDRQAYASRRDRIYLPKLEWALSRMSEAGLEAEHALQASWLELGCGAGYFLDALRVKGASDFLGIDENRELIAVAGEALGSGSVRVTDDLLADLAASEAKIVAAFFVLEHLEAAERFWRVMGERPAGTVCLLAVPALGLSALLEGAFDGFAARSLDSVLHTQLYTDRSLDFALDMAGYDKVAEWLFGQDAADLCRVLGGRIASAMGGRIGAEFCRKLAELVDPLQAVIDRTRLCDARHILAVKR